MLSNSIATGYDRIDFRTFLNHPIERFLELIRIVTGQPADQHTYSYHRIDCTEEEVSE